MREGPLPLAACPSRLEEAGRGSGEAASSPEAEALGAMAELMAGMLGMRGVEVKSRKSGLRVGRMGACSCPARKAGDSAAFLGMLLLPGGAGNEAAVDALSCCRFMKGAC